MTSENHISPERLAKLEAEAANYKPPKELAEKIEKVLDKASKWVVNYVGTVRPTITYIFVLELVLINIAYTTYVFMHPDMIKTMDDLIKTSTIIFSDDEMAMLGGIIGFWFGSRQWNKK